jgi:hypothetical protein
MKKILLSFMALGLTLSSWAYDFMGSDDGFYYTITSSTAPYTVQVTYETMGATANYTGDANPDGSLTIPATTKYNGITYSVTSIGSLAFYDNGYNSWSGFTSITLPSTITSIGSDAFRGCKKLTSITIPAATTTLGSSAFLNCSSLASVTILSNITAINYNTFEGCSSLTSITLPSTVTSIGSSAFYGCVKLTSITIPSGVTSIATHTFRDCSSLTSITLPSGVTSIGQFAFYGCSGLTSATIPSTVTSIGDYAFNGCSSLTTITCLATTPPSTSSATFSNTSSTVVVPCTSIDTYKATSYWNSFGNYSVATFTQNGIRYQPNALCNEVSVLSNSYSGSVTIPASVTYNGTIYAVTSIGNNAFYNCTGLTSVSIPEGVTSIGNYTFYNCYSLTSSLTLPSTLTSIGNYAFLSCSMTSVNIPEAVTSIGDFAFSGCSHITSLTIPEKVTSIGANAFQGCHGLTSLTISSDNTAIGYSAFYDCTGLTSLTIPSSVIGERAFYGCTGLTSVVISSSVTAIGKNAFTNCTGLTALTISSACNAIGESVFVGCTGLTAVTIPSSVIGTSAFAGCTGLTSVVFTSSVTSIGSIAFYGCTNLVSATIASSVTSIGAEAFSECTGLTSIYAKSTAPGTITLGTNVFYNVNKSTCTLYIPTGSYAAYKGAAQWQSFLNTVEASPTVTTQAVSDITAATATGNGTITNLGYPANVIDYGVCWSSTNSTPTIEDSYVSNGITTTTGAFPASLTELTAGTTYYVRAYATNDTGTAYGNVVSFKNTSTGTENTFSSDARISIQNGQLVIRKLVEEETITVYNIQGIAIYGGKVSADTQTISLPAGGVYIVKVGEKVEKVVYP